MKKRVSIKFIEKSLKQYPIVALTGPRQSGKTTLLKSHLSAYTYISLENPDNREFATQDPKGFLEKYNDKVIFDEAQQAPKLFSYMQSIVDESGKMGQFILSGSQNFQLMEKITQSLAGRVALHKLLPFDTQEMKTAEWLADDLSEVMVNGCYPALHQRKINPDKYYRDYIETYVNRDVTQLVNVQNKNQFKTFVKLIADRAGQLINYNNIARDAGISHTTARNWISILETSYIIFQLPPYFKNFSKRIIKSPKLYFYDTGLLCHLLDIRRGKFSVENSAWGHVFENLITSELVKRNYHREQLREYWFWRDSHGLEVDMLYKTGEELNVYEIKAGKTISSKQFANLQKFASISNSVKSMHLIYGGEENQKRNDVNILSWKAAQ